MQQHLSERLVQGQQKWGKGHGTNKKLFKRRRKAGQRFTSLQNTASLSGNRTQYKKKVKGLTLKSLHGSGALPEV